MPATLPTEALALAWAAQVGAVTWAEVVDWADGWMVRLDAPPAELLELSLSARRPNEAFTLVRRLAQRGEAGAALSMLARRLKEAIDAERMDAVTLASRLVDVSALSLEEPDDVRLSPPPLDFRTAAHALFSVWVERGVYGEEKVFDRNLSEEVEALLQRSL